MPLSYPYSLILPLISTFFFLSPLVCHGWVSQTPCSLHPGYSPSSTRSSLNGRQDTQLPFSSRDRLRFVLASSTSSADSLSVPASDDDDDDDEYEYVEYDILREEEFQGSEWLMGTVMNGRNKIDETWVRLGIDNNGKNVAIWGDNGEGSWNFDVASQFLSVSKDSIIGKNIWAGVVDDYYYCQGTVRGWNFFTAAAVVGQWQAKRLGVEKGEAGVAPWFQEKEDEEPPALTDSDSTTSGE